MLTLVVFAVAVVLWTCTPLDDTFVALAAVVTLLLFGVLPASALAVLGGSTTWLLIAAFVLAAGVSASGLPTRLATSLVGRARSVRGLMHLTAFALLLTAFFVPSTSGRAALTLPVYRALRVNARVSRALGVLFPSVILLTAVATLVGAGAHLITSALLEQATGQGIGFGQWMLLGLPLAVVSAHVTAEVVLWLFTSRADRAEPLVGAAEPLTGHGEPLTGHAEPLADGVDSLVGGVGSAGRAESLAGRAGASTGHPQPLAGRAGPLAGHTQPLAGRMEPLASHTQPLNRHTQPSASHAQLLTGHAEPLAGRTQPLADRVEPLADRTPPLADRVEPLAGRTPPLTGRVEPLADHTQPLNRRTQPLTGRAKPLTGHTQPLNVSHEPTAALAARSEGPLPGDPCSDSPRQHRQFSALTRPEITSLVIVGVVSAGWLTESWHHVPPEVTALAGAVAITAPRLGTTTLKAAFAEIPWSLLLFMAATTMLGSALVSSGAAHTVATLINPAHLLPTVIVVSLLAHLVIQSRSARSSVLVPIVIPLAAAAGMNPAALAFISTAAAGFCHTTTASAKPVALFADAYSQRDLLKLSAVLAPITGALVLACAVLLWPHLGLPLK
ncbi:SLC13 family permease [Lentzea sp. NEAU-D7]|uniref:SLC13 family permease n=1 Tax=Lentzea sp. NEAU-D7 TaxID=2994667 RepID=UPI00224B2237|nr:SLC13 family permease [Lentzea sp. NEAU-D7]MCX2947882.1 SLC13 family permease [Lentzea sp. NEAU-D7]